jgi:uncharacterized membrane protein YccC
MLKFDVANRIAFAVRCAASGTLAYLLATAVGLPHPVWASMSSLIVSQESFDATRDSIAGRIMGTVIGVLVAVLVGEAANRIGAGIAIQIAVAVGICALFAEGRPSIRVSIWTCPIVLLTVPLDASVTHAGLMRGSEVLLGSLVGGLIHWFMRRWTRTTRELPQS